VPERLGVTRSGWTHVAGPMRWPISEPTPRNAPAASPGVCATATVRCGSWPPRALRFCNRADHGSARRRGSFTRELERHLLACGGHSPGRDVRVAPHPPQCRPAVRMATPQTASRVAWRRCVRTTDRLTNKAFRSGATKCRDLVASGSHTPAGRARVRRVRATGEGRAVAPAAATRSWLLRQALMSPWGLSTNFLAAPLSKSS
jgi:hypothetical protein